MLRPSYTKKWHELSNLKAKFKIALQPGSWFRHFLLVWGYPWQLSILNNDYRPSGPHRAPPLSPATKGLEFLSKGLTFRFVTVHFCNALVKRQQRSIPTTSSLCQDRPAPSPRSRGGDIDCGLLLLLLFLLLLLPLFLLRTPVTWPASDLNFNWFLVSDEPSLMPSCRISTTFCRISFQL